MSEKHIRYTFFGHGWVAMHACAVIINSATYNDSTNYIRSTIKGPQGIQSFVMKTKHNLYTKVKSRT